MFTGFNTIHKCDKDSQPRRTPHGTTARPQLRGQLCSNFSGCIGDVLWILNFDLNSNHTQFNADLLFYAAGSRCSNTKVCLSKLQWLFSYVYGMYYLHVIYMCTCICFVVRSLLVISHEMTTVVHPVKCPSIHVVSCQHFRNFKAPRLLGQHQ